MSRLLDTNIVSEILKAKNQIVVQRAAAYFRQYPKAFFSAVSRYEILRGLRAKKATRKEAQFEAFCQRHTVHPLSNAILDLAADLWAELKKKGQLIEDMDLFIAATALHHSLPLATGNVAHFGRVPGLTIEDWTKP